nr:hypothetical protein [Nanoarchaeota archaeon]
MLIEIIEKVNKLDDEQIFEELSKIDKEKLNEVDESALSICNSKSNCMLLKIPYGKKIGDDHYRKAQLAALYVISPEEK